MIDRTSIAILIIFIALFSFGAGFAMKNDRDQEDGPKTGEAVQFDELKKKVIDDGKSYQPFFQRSTLHCGVYHLKAGAKDGQSPHREDEVYYVESGKAVLHVDGVDYPATPGTVLFVAAKAKHHFHSIEEDLTLLVFFSKAEPK